MSIINGLCQQVAERQQFIKYATSRFGVHDLMTNIRPLFICIQRKCERSCLHLAKKSTTPNALPINDYLIHKEQATDINRSIRALTSISTDTPDKTHLLPCYPKSYWFQCANFYQKGVE